MKPFEVIYNYFNNSFFQNKLPLAEFSFDVSKKYPMRWVDGCIIIGSEFVSLNEYEIVLSIIHEMIHIYNDVNRIEDVGINQYHKKQFLELALQLGFFVIKHKSQGWSIISPIPPRNAINSISVKCPMQTRNKILIENISNLDLDKKEFKQIIKNIYASIVNTPASKTFFLKYQCKCPEPHNSIRSGRRPIGDQKNHPNAMCKLCGNDFICVSEIPD